MAKGGAQTRPPTTQCCTHICVFYVQLIQIQIQIQLQIQDNGKGMGPDYVPITQ